MNINNHMLNKPSDFNNTFISQFAPCEKSSMKVTFAFQRHRRAQEAASPSEPRSRATMAVDHPRQTPQSPMSSLGAK